MRWPTLIALAMALGICGVEGSAQANPGESADVASTSSTADAGGAAFPEDHWLDETQTATSTPDETATVDPPGLRSQEATPVAPLPPAIFMGPVGIGLVALASYRLRKKGI